MDVAVGTDALTVACIENEEIARLGLRAKLNEAGIDTEVYDSVESALEDLTSAPPDVVICDLHLGTGVSGPEAVHLIAEVMGLRLVACSGSAGSITVANAVAAGALGHLCKTAMSTPLLWATTVRRAAAGVPSLSSALATALLSDHHTRPLPDGHGFGPSHLEALAAAQDGIDLQEVPGEWTGNPAAWPLLVADIFAIVRRRARRWRLNVTADRVLQVGYLMLYQMRWSDIAKQMGVKDSTAKGNAKVAKEVVDARLADLGIRGSWSQVQGAAAVQVWLDHCSRTGHRALEPLVSWRWAEGDAIRHRRHFWG